MFDNVSYRISNNKHIYVTVNQKSRTDFCELQKYQLNKLFGLLVANECDDKTMSDG